MSSKRAKSRSIFNRMAANGQIFKEAAVHGDAAFGRVLGMLGVQAADDAAGGEDVEHVEVFQDGGDKGVVAAIGILKAAGDMSVAAPEGDEFVELEVFDAGTAVASGNGEGGAGLDVNGFDEGASEVAAESVCARMVSEVSRRFRGHGRSS